MAGPAGLDERAERLLPPRVTPAEVVEQRDAVGIGPRRHGVGDRLDNGSGRHLVGIEPAEPVPQAHAKHDAAVAAEHAADHGAIGGALSRPEERLDDRAALHLVVVLTDDPLLARHVGQREHAHEALAERARAVPGHRHGSRAAVP